MASWTDDWNVRYGRPRGSIELPVRERFDVRKWAKEIARGVLAPGAPKEQVAALADALAEATLDSRRRDPVSAVFFCPDPALGELARIEVSDYVPDGAYPEITLPMMAEWLSSPTRQSVRPAEVTYVDLPIGPAVQVRHQYVAAGPGGPGASAVPQGGGAGNGETDRDGGNGENAGNGGDAGNGGNGGDAGNGGDGDEGLGRIVQTCAYAARPPEIGAVVLLMASWQALAYSDQLFDLTARIAQMLRLERK
ncbi:hypothetical protein VSR01_22790 [Actinacidiphila sp. DG2A-62]|uniref:hypothetical protein n=1 Tax=Actinacidiphila sp. DG2A-62 TaxID=3108821 RepID=UPI002DBF21C0|nr:hypothetical protein [Actinacidiphila sp. DG2A-62]MEC3996189.1 hypothetical protein [Actinacidiphila sp. DG2A-62]